MFWKYYSPGMTVALYSLTAADHCIRKSPGPITLSMKLKEARMQSFREAAFLRDTTTTVWQTSCFSKLTED